MLETLTRIIGLCEDAVWGMPLIVTVFLTGILYTFLLKGVHIRRLGYACRCMFHPETDGHGDVSAFGALCTALSATIGIGNIVGVATAVALGGPGSLFWMTFAAFLGMGTKYAEGLLAVKYRELTPSGTILGGPFHYIEKGLGRRWKPLAVAFAFFGATAAIMGVGTLTQVNGITSAVQRFFAPDFTGDGYPFCIILTGIIVTIATAAVLLGGIKRIATVSTVVVPFMAMVYVMMCAAVVIAHARYIPEALSIILRSAFDPSAVTGGAVGTMFAAVQKGISRGIFSNEAGLGSAPIAAAAAKSSSCVRQGLVCMMGTVFCAIVCFATGIAIVMTGAGGVACGGFGAAQGLNGADMTIEAFSRGLSFLPGSGFIASLTLMVSLVFFAFTTIVGWNYYGERCLEYLIGPGHERSIMTYRLAYLAVVALGPYLTVKAVWSFATTFSGLMAFPNLVALVLLSPVVAKATKEYFKRSDNP